MRESKNKKVRRRRGREERKGEEEEEKEEKKIEILELKRITENMSSEQGLLMGYFSLQKRCMELE